MQLVTYAQRLFCVFGLGVMLSACGSIPDPPAPTTYAEVYGNMKSACVPCHVTAGSAAKKFILDTANSATTYTNLMTNSLINKATPDQSPLIVVGKGGSYTPMGGSATPHAKSLPDAMAANWVSWIAAGANQ